MKKLVSFYTALKINQKIVLKTGFYLQDFRIALLIKCQ